MLPPNIQKYSDEVFKKMSRPRQPTRRELEHAIAEAEGHANVLALLNMYRTLLPMRDFFCVEEKDPGQTEENEPDERPY